MVVGVYLRSGYYILGYNILQCAFVGVVNRLCFYPSAAFAHTDNGLLANCSASGMFSLTRMLVLFFTAYIGFINFHYAGQPKVALLACFAYPLEHKPC